MDEPEFEYLKGLEPGPCPDELRRKPITPSKKRACGVITDVESVVTVTDPEGNTYDVRVDPTLDRYMAMAIAWRASTPASIMSTREILVETLRILDREAATVDASNEAGMEVSDGKVYGEENDSFSDRKNWEN